MGVSSVSVLNKDLQAFSCLLDIPLKDELLQKLGNYLDLSELSSALTDDADILMVSGAGSGKTTALALRLILDDCERDLGERILVTTFLRSGIDDVEKVYKNWCTRLGVQINSNIVFKTIHALCMDWLKGMGVRFTASTMLTASERSSILRRLIVEHRLLPNHSVSIEELQDIDTLLGYMQNRLCPDYTHPVFTGYRLKATQWLAFVEAFAAEKRRMCKLDFEDLQTLLFNAYKSNPNVIRYVSSCFSYVYIDEFQDTSQIQYGLVKPVLQAAKRFFVIGDDDQSIYGWRGSDVDIMLSCLPSDFPALSMHYLSTNRRSATEIVEFAGRSIVLNKNRFPKALKGVKSGGSISYHDYAHGAGIYSSVSSLLKLCEASSYRGTVVVLGRTNNDLCLPVLHLLASNIDIGVTSNVNFVEGKAFTSVLNLMSLLLPVARKSKYVLGGLMDLGIPQKAAGSLADILRTNNASLFDLSFDDLSQFISRVSDDYRCRSLLSLYRVLEKEPILSKRVSLLFSHIRDVVYGQAYENRERYGGFLPKYVQMVENYMEYYVGRLLSDSSLTISSLLQEANDLVDALHAVKSDPFSHSVVFSTVHEAKGKEFDSVIIWNASSDSFPARIRRELTLAEMAEERRVFYIGNTRARTYLHFFVGDVPSVFLTECDPSFSY